MNFCETCGFILYKKLGDTESCKDSVSEKSGSCELFEYCKNCGFEKEITDTNISIYKRDYRNTFAVDNILKNKYIVYDNTLPRLKTDCKNINCITDSKYNHLNSENALRVFNIPENISSDTIKNVLNNFSHGNITKEIVDDTDYVKTINGLKIYFKRIKLCSIVIYYEHDDIDSQIDTVSDLNIHLTEYLTKYNVLDEFGQNEKFLVEPYDPIENEILFVKYDPDNMKYLYMCVNCGTSW